MGSPSARLKTPEKLRPWLESGLEFVLQSGKQGQAEHVVQQTVHQPEPAQQVVDRQAPVQQPVQSNPPTGQLVQQPIPPSETPVSTGGFPEPWATFLKKVPASPKVVWTYMELGLDLAGQSDPRRGAVLRNLLGHHLQWPTGTTAFWPVAALKNNALQPDRNMFWRGWEMWKTPYIACFGEEALRVIHPHAEPGNTTYLLEQVTIFVLPPLAKLITMLPHEQQMSIDVLKGLRF